MNSHAATNQLNYNNGRHDLWFTPAQQAPAVLNLVMSSNFSIKPVGTCMGDSQWCVVDTIWNIHHY